MIAVSTPHPLPKPRPQVRRLPGRKRMTIAIGLLATDGVVIAADTQESAGYPGDMKSSGTKILGALRSDASNPPVTGAFAVSGAGTVGNLDAVNQKLAESFSLSAGITLNELPAFLSDYIDYLSHTLYLLP